MGSEIGIFVLDHRVTVIVARLVILVSGRANLEVVCVLIVTLKLELVLHRCGMLWLRKLCRLVVLMSVHDHRSVVRVGPTSCFFV